MTTRAGLRAVGVSKTYGGVTALTPTNFEVRPGRVHALLGANGAGKSTLVKILTGSVQPDAGRLLLGDEEVAFTSTAKATSRGIAVVSQELSLFPDLSVLANLFLLREPRRHGLVVRRDMADRARPVLAELGLSPDVMQPLGHLSLADQQLVEIARALLADPSVLVLDEPTSALEARASDRLLRVLAVLKARGTGVVFVSHILEEVLTVADDITVLRDGSTVLDERPRDELDLSKIVAAMLGDNGAASDRAAANGRVAFTVTQADAPLRIVDVPLLKGTAPASLVVHPGEIVGLAGLIGAGHQEVLRLASGVSRPISGQVLLPGLTSAPRNRRDAVDAGVAMVSGERRRLGLMLDKPLWENIAQVRSVAMRQDGMFIRRSVLRQRASEQMARLGVKASSVDAPAGSLSGGNQQKIVFAQWLELRPQLLLLDDPSRGVDVGAKREMHELIRTAARNGAVVLICSSDNEELADVCSRVVVCYRGEFVADLSGEQLDRHRLLAAINQGVPEGSAA